MNDFEVPSPRDVPNWARWAARGKRRAARGCSLALAATLALAVGVAGAQAGQQAPSAPPPAARQAAPAGGSHAPGQISVIVKVVNVPVTVLDKRGVPVIDLTKNDFQILENGHPQTIRYFVQGSKPPLRVGVILDTSNSARRQIKFEQDAATEFVFEMLQGRSNQNQIFLQTFDATSSILQDFTYDPEVLNEKIHTLKGGGGKALYDAIYFACRNQMMAKTGRPDETRRVLVVISDGVDVQSQHSLDEAISMAHLAETAIYTISNTPYGYDNPGDSILRQLAHGTAGAAFFPLADSPGTDLGTGYLSHGQIGDTSQNKGLGASTGIYGAERLAHLADALASIGEELKQQYSLGYTPTNPALDGTYRTIKVVVARRNVSLRAKPGYFASPEAAGLTADAPDVSGGASPK